MGCYPRKLTCQEGRKRVNTENHAGVMVNMQEGDLIVFLAQHKENLQVNKLRGVVEKTVKREEKRTSKKLTSAKLEQ